MGVAHEVCSATMQQQTKHQGTGCSQPHGLPGMRMHEVICALGGIAGPVSGLLLQLVQALPGGTQPTLDFSAHFARTLAALARRAMQQALRFIDRMGKLFGQSGPMFLRIGLGIEA